MDLLVEQIIFFAFAGMTVLAGAVVVAVRNPVHSVLALVVAFVASAGLWLLLEAEFLALVLIFVYVGAVMTLFLFVVMMLNIRELPSREGFVRFLPLALFALAAIVAMMVFVIGPQHFGLAQYAIPAHHGADYSNIRELGLVLYTHDVYPFELAAVLLLIAIIAAISLSFRGRRVGTRSQVPSAQIAVKSADRIRIIKMASEPKVKR